MDLENGDLMFWNISTLILLVLILSLIFMRVIFTVIMYKTETPSIKSADNNISTTTFERIANSLKERLGLSEWNILQNSNDEYNSVANCVNHKKKVISITKFLVPSVGYEIDNLLGTIWFASKLINNDKKFTRFTLALNVFNLMFEILFYVSALLQFALWFVYKYDVMIVINSSLLFYIKSHSVLFFTSLAILIVASFIQVLIYGSKNSIEELYEREISAFVSSECREFSQDIVAARTFALNWKPILVPVFARKASSLRYLGPFVIFR
jgi:hypothetical protein